MYSRHKCFQLPVVEFQSTRLSRASTSKNCLRRYLGQDFNPQGSHEPRRWWPRQVIGLFDISIHKALTSLDDKGASPGDEPGNFNPQGSHEPRLFAALFIHSCQPFQSTRLSRASTSLLRDVGQHFCHFNPQGSHEPRHHPSRWNGQYEDFNPQGSHEPRQQKYTIILASMPNLYILIIHLQQIIQQVKKFSRILILFSGRLQCESPWNFMCNYYSHQSFLTKNQPSFKLPPLSLCAKFSRTILNII